MDLADAHISALNKLDNPKNQKNFHFFNLGTGNPFSVLDIISIFNKVSNVNLKYEIGERRFGDVESAYTDTAKANSELDWKAKVSIHDSIRNAWLWEKKIRKI